MLLFSFECLCFTLSCDFQDHSITASIVVQGNDSFLCFKMLVRNSGIFADMIPSLLNYRKLKFI